MKTCPMCKKLKPLEDFGMRKTRHGNLAPSVYCRPCAASYERSWRKKNPDKVKVYRNNLRQTYAGQIAFAISESEDKSAVRDAVAFGVPAHEAAQSLSVGPIAKRILEQIKDGCGEASLDAIIERMYSDRQNRDRVYEYNSFKRIAFGIRKRLIGTGVSLENLGYGKGYALVLKPGA